jgi:hypothetical protein
LRQTTRIRAVVLGGGVAVIAGFDQLALVVGVGSDNAVAASRWSASVGAAVRVVFVAVIAELFGADDPVAADLRAAFITLVVRVVVAIIATFTHADHSITAELRRAVVLAVIRFVIIAVITGFKAFITFDQVRADHAIAAAG